ncbi:MAG TPA: hypothetical protein ENO03_03455 [Candidatus Aminicenantes bacterium]|nr:hypothetical protein [Candidatus Aminicenantes bacterium]HDT13394.1 hypothetical protein [Candidatus Aminicenantes bacterium]
MKIRGPVIALLLALVAVYFIFFAKVSEDKGGLEIMVDEYLESKIDLTRVNLEAVSREVLAYAADGSGLPETLDALRRFHPAAVAQVDAWGGKIRYEKLSDDAFRLSSAGPDRAFGTGDDIVKDF